MDVACRAGSPTSSRTGSARRPRLLAWAVEREIALAHRRYWSGRRSPAASALAVLLYPPWLVLAVPLAAALGVLKVALLGALMTAIAASTFVAARRPSPAPAPVRRRFRQFAG